MALFTTVIVVAVLKLAQEVFIPLALAILCTFLLAPLVLLLTRLRVNRVIAVILSLSLGLALIGGLGTLVFNQFADLARELPSYQQQLRANLKQWGGLRPKSGGRKLDGREWSQFPEIRSTYSVAAE